MVCCIFCVDQKNKVVFLQCVCVCLGVRVHVGERSVQPQAAPQLFPNGKYVFLLTPLSGVCGCGL